MSDFAEKIVVLRDSLTDAHKGFEQAVGDARDAHFKRMFDRAAGEHATSLQTIRPHLPLDVEERAGTIVGAVTRAIDYVRGAVGGDESLLPGMIDGETRVLEACEEARAAASDPAALTALADVRERIGRVVAELRAAHAAAA